MIMAYFECAKCDKSYKTKGNLTQHQRMHKGTAFACDFCEKRFYTKTHLSQHRVAHTFAKPYACDVDGCEKKYTQNGGLLKHKRAVHEKVVGKYRCEQCDREYNNWSALNVHHRLHTGERPYTCAECAMKFIQKNHLQEHFRRKHTDERPFACDKCDKRFSTKHNAQLHRGVHTFSKPFMCDVDGCEKRFTANASVVVHKRFVHEKVRKYRCEHCDKSFGSLADLKRHNRLHTKKRSYACDVLGCEKVFASKQKAINHIRCVHEKVAAEHKCEQCKRTFTESANLRRHQRTHNGEHPFACTQCAKKFAQKANLQHHLGIKHAWERPFACVHCQKTFATVQGRTHHTNRVHKLCS